MSNRRHALHRVLPALTLITASLAAAPALAHTGEGIAGGFMSGLLHPIFGWDHVVAMVAVGLWGGILEKPSIWLLPIVFPLVMALGGAAGVLGIEVPFVEAGIALSGLVLGLMVAFFVKLPLAAAVAMVAVFAIFHGHAHGTELPDAANPIAYAVGFVIATGLLHLGGIAFGMLAFRDWGKWVVRAGGAGIALVGGAFLTGIA